MADGRWTGMGQGWDRAGTGMGQGWDRDGTGMEGPLCAVLIELAVR